MEPQLSIDKPIFPRHQADANGNVLDHSGSHLADANPPASRIPQSEATTSGWAHLHPNVLAMDPPPERAAHRPQQHMPTQAPVNAFDHAHNNTLSTLDRLNDSPTTAPLHQNAKTDLAALLPAAVRDQYDGSIERLESNIYGIAEAVSSLDGIDLQLLTAKEHIQKLHRLREPVDYIKVKRVLEEMGHVISGVIEDLDHAEINLLRDAKVKIAFTEIGSDATSTRNVDLNLISLEKLIKLSRTLENDPEQIDRFIGALSRALDSNIQVLSSLMLTLFAARDYTNSVTEIALEAGVMKRLTDAKMRAGNGGAAHTPQICEQRYIPETDRQELTGRKEGRDSLLKLLQSPARGT